VKAEKERLMKDYPAIYTSENTAVRRAVINLSGRDFDTKRIDAYKQEYDNFAWDIALAPADDPEVAVVVMIVQGDKAANATPTLRECIGKYFELKNEDKKNKFKVDYTTFFEGDNRDNTIEKVFD
jgi:penicillin-binding protein 2